MSLLPLLVRTAREDDSDVRIVNVRQSSFPVLSPRIYTVFFAFGLVHSSTISCHLLPFRLVILLSSWLRKRLPFRHSRLLF